jgi:hypothetical protein
MSIFDAVGTSTRGIYGRQWTKPKRTKVKKVRRTRTVNGNVTRVLVKAPERRMRIDERTVKGLPRAKKGNRFLVIKTSKRSRYIVRRLM